MAYLGPKGTYAEKAASALAKLANLEDPEFVPCSGIRIVIEQVAKKLCDFAVVPIENSVEGGVTATLDGLWSNPSLSIQKAVVLPIQHSLVSSGSIGQISEVLSHPQALAQCSSWLANNLPNALQLQTNSTAEAVKMVIGSNFRAAIAPRASANISGIKELSFPINDVSGNRTRFVLLHIDKSTAKGNIGSFAFSLNKNAPGALLEALACIANLGLNMTRIESRPSKRELGEYVFFVDIELSKNTHDADKLLTQLLSPLCAHLVNFGSYTSTEMNID